MGLVECARSATWRVHTSALAAPECAQQNVRRRKDFTGPNGLSPGKHTCRADAHDYGLGRRCRAGFGSAAGLRVQARRGGSADTTVGSSRVFSLLSIAATIARGATKSIGAEKTRIASLLQTGHGAPDPAIPIGRLTSKMPSTTHRYRYIAMCALSQVSCASETGSARSVGFEWLFRSDTCRS